MKITILMGTLAAAFVAGAETLVFSPENGATTNVTARLTGGADVSANPGASGGGIVRLLAPYSDYTGTTANNCGTLWPSFLGFDSSYGSLGATSQLTLGPGTLKYTGQSGTISAPVVHSGANTDYSVYEIGEGSELTLKGSLTSVARLVKTGAGTLRLAYGGSEQIVLGGGGKGVDGCYRLGLNANGDAPTGKGGAAALSVVAGKVAIDSGNWKLTGNFPLCCGLYTVADTGTETKEQEPSGTFEINGGTVAVDGLVNLGVNNGFTMNTPEGPTTSAIIINGGTVSFNNNMWFGRSYYDPTEGLVANANPSFVMHGGNVSQYPAGCFMMGNMPGMLSELTIDGGTYKGDYCAIVSGNVLTTGVRTGDAKGDSSTTNVVTIAGTADVMFGKIENQNDEVTFVRLNDSSVLKTCFIFNNSGFLSLDFNGGTLYKFFDVEYQGAQLAMISNSVSRVTVGAKGGTIGAYERYGTSRLAIIEKGIEPFPGLATGTDGGMTFASALADGRVRLFGISSHYGPTTIGLGITELAGAGRLSPNARLVLNGGTLVITNVVQTVAGLTVGETATTTAETLKFTKTLPLAVTGSVVIKGTPTLSIVPLEADGSVSTTLGDYTILSAPKAQKTMLEALTVHCTAPNIAGAYFNVVEDGDLVKLVIQATDPGLDPVNPNVGYWTASGGGLWTAVENWLDGRIATTFDMTAVFAEPSVEGGAPLTLPTADVELENLEIEAGAYRVADGTLHPLRMDVVETGDFEIAGGNHVVDGTLYLGGGDEVLENKLTVSGGSLTCDKLYMKYKSGTANAESSTLEISGGVVTAKTEVIVAYDLGTGTNKFTMTGGKLVTPSFKAGGGTKVDRERTTELSFANCELDLGTGTFFRDNLGEHPKTCVFGAGSVIRAARIYADAPSDQRLTFDGGTFRPTKATSNQKTSGIEASYLFTGQILSGGMFIDMSEVAATDGDIQNYVPISYVVRDGTAIATGGGCAYFYGYGHVFHNGTIVSSNDATVIVSSTAAQANSGQCSPIRIEPGAAFRFSNATMVYKKAVTLGRADATVPARLEFNDENDFAKTTYQFTANPLVVNSPVSVAWCTNGWTGVATCPDGVYTGIVYTTKNSVVDPANFVLPTYYQSWKSLSTEIIDYSETQQALVFTVTTTGEEPEPPAPEPETIETLVVPSGESVALEDGTTVKNLTIGAGSWNTASVSGDFFVTQVFSLGLAAGEYASAKVSGDVTMKSGSVLKVDVDDSLRNYDLLVVDGDLTVEKGVVLDYGRTDTTPLPRKFKRVPLATATGMITVPDRLAATGTGWEYEKIDLTVEGSVLYASRAPKGLMVIVR